MSDILGELIDMGVDEDRIAEARDAGRLAELYDRILWECSEEQFPGKD